MIIHIPAFSTIKRQYQIVKKGDKYYITDEKVPWTWIHLNAESQIHHEFAEITTKEQVLEFCNNYGAICGWCSIDQYFEQIEYVKFLLSMPKERWTEHEIWEFNNHLKWNITGGNRNRPKRFQKRVHSGQRVCDFTSCKRGWCL